MSVERFSDSSDFHHDATLVPMGSPGTSRSETAITQSAAPCLASREGPRASRGETSAVKLHGYGVVPMMKRFVYHAARRLLRLRIANVLVLDLTSMCGASPNTSTFEFRFITANEIRAAASDPANDLDADIAGRLESGRNFCFGAFDRGRLANYSWYALGQVEPEHSFGAGLVLPGDAVYLYKAFTLPAYRGHRLHQATVHRALPVFVRLGIRRLIAIVEYGEWASLRSHDRMGCRRAGRFYLLGQRLISWRCELSESLGPSVAT